MRLKLQEPQNEDNQNRKVRIEQPSNTDWQDVKGM